MLLCCWLFVACAVGAKLKWHEVDASYTFEAYLQHHGKSYLNQEEYLMRKTIFEANLEHVIAHNQDITKTWKEEMNHLADWTDEVCQYAPSTSHSILILIHHTLSITHTLNHLLTYTLACHEGISSNICIRSIQIFEDMQRE